MDRKADKGRSNDTTFKHRIPSNGWLNAFLTIWVVDHFDLKFDEESELRGAEAIKNGWKGQTLTIHREDLDDVLKCLTTALDVLDGQIEEKRYRKTDPEGTAMDLKMVGPALNLQDKLVRWNWKRP